MLSEEIDDLSDFPTVKVMFVGNDAHRLQIYLNLPPAFPNVHMRWIMIA